MPGARLPMRKIGDVLRLRAGGMSKRQIAASLSIGPTAAGDCIRRARPAGLSWPLPEGLSDEAPEARRCHDEPPSPRKCQSRQCSAKPSAARASEATIRAGSHEQRSFTRNQINKGTPEMTAVPPSPPAL
jgi:hypothetical protein